MQSFFVSSFFLDADLAAHHQATHHSLVPQRRGPSAYAKRHHVTHGLPMPLAMGGAFVPRTTSRESGGGGEGEGMEFLSTGPPPAVRNAILRALAMNAELKPGKSTDSGVEALQSQWRNTSIGV